MNKSIFKMGLVVLLLLLPVSLTAVKIVSWNVLEFYGDLSGDRIEDFRKVMDELQPDVLILQDMGDSDGVTLFLNQVLNHKKKLYKKAKFTNQDDTSTALFYNKKTIKYNSIEEIATLSRSVWGYKVKIRKGEGKGKTLYLYSVHLPEGNNAVAKNKRDDDTQLFRDYLDSKHKNGDLFLACGTFNLAGTKDKAFKILTGEGDVSNGRLHDPLDLTGKWFKKKKFASTHTLSTRKMAGEMGASGGLTARFDNFFISEGIAENDKFTYKDGSYVAYGNDGKHFKKAVTVPDNQAIDQDVAEALYRASDHLPIVIELGEPGGDMPLPPSNLSAEALSSASVDLSWQDNSNNEDGFHLARVTDCFSCHGNNHCNACHGGFPGYPNSPLHVMSGHDHSWKVIQNLSSNVQSHQDTGLSGNRSYIYRVRAFNAGGNSAWSNQAEATTSATSNAQRKQEK